MEATKRRLKRPKYGGHEEKRPERPKYGGHTKEVEISLGKTRYSVIPRQGGEKAKINNLPNHTKDEMENWCPDRIRSTKKKADTSALTELLKTGNWRR
jgi:hypothetical protein